MRFQIITVDPPWLDKYRGRKSRDANGGRITHADGTVEHHFKMLSDQDLFNLPVVDVAEKNAILFLWILPEKLAMAPLLMQVWGFNYRTYGFSWIKTTASGKPVFGMGTYAKSNLELCLLGVRGKPIHPVVNTESSVILASRPGKFGAKPLEYLDRIDRMFPGCSRLELFARNPRPGWRSLGNEIDGRDIRESLPALAVL